MDGNIISKSVLRMNLGATRLTGRPTNRWQDELRGIVRIVGGKIARKKLHN